MLIPDYNGGSLLNLMSSIINKYNGHTDYSALKILPSESMKNNKTIFILIDAFWYSSIPFVKDLIEPIFDVNRITTVFPTSTTSVITTINTWEPPWVHGLVSWTQNMKSLGLVWIPLIHSTRYYNPISFTDSDFSEVYWTKLNTIYEKLKVDSSIITKTAYRNSIYTKTTSKWVKNIASYESAYDIPKLLENELRTSSEYIYLYFDNYDIASHEYGYDDDRAIQVLRNILWLIVSYIKIESLPFNLIITGDHGQICSGTRINLSDFPLLNSFLVIPPTGDARHMNFFVKNGKNMDFLSYFKDNFSNYFDIFSYEEVLSLWLYGVSKDSDWFRDVFWDYLAIAKNNYTIWNYLFNESVTTQRGEHGWLSENELFIPLLSKK